MKRFIRKSVKADTNLPLTDRQASMATKLFELYRKLFDLLDNKEFAEGGEFEPLLNNPDLADEIQDEMMYLSTK